MTEIYLIRHGETEWNAAGRFQGRLDSPLTDKGFAQAMACGRAIAHIGVRPDRFLSSPLGRTRETAYAIAAGAELPSVEFDARLAEVSLGSWDGLTMVDIDHQWPGLLDGSTPFDWFFRSPDGEIFEAARARTKSLLDEIEGIAVIVSHGLIGRIIRGIYANLSMAEALALPVPQNVIWHLRDQRIDAIHVG
ncbi:putative phosphoglycerate mutase [Erythromicrobium ramosum]|uniref:Histidine phosphatase family protein n=1 Tax=Erythrobacter ramosus TaxID=35811 RepID=A0A6I4UIZ2_9SPHN|nr:histidine phosphatase family protein [Erythrobacter ramosus]MBB3775817.1 putative phosphoglycerate mutase [Erythrobacter ramosus]MXP39091.1 histidine phosphatase family protein [Erythrobacter ramosus]